MRAALEKHIRDFAKNPDAEFYLDLITNHEGEFTLVIVFSVEYEALNFAKAYLSAKPQATPLCGTKIDEISLKATLKNHEQYLYPNPHDYHIPPKCKYDVHITESQFDSWFPRLRENPLCFEDVLYLFSRDAPKIRRTAAILEKDSDAQKNPDITTLGKWFHNGRGFEQVTLQSLKERGYSKIASVTAQLTEQVLNLFNTHCALIRMLEYSPNNTGSLSSFAKLLRDTEYFRPTQQFYHGAHGFNRWQKWDPAQWEPGKAPENYNRNFQDGIGILGQDSQWTERDPERKRNTQGLITPRVAPSPDNLFTKNISVSLVGPSLGYSLFHHREFRGGTVCRDITYYSIGLIFDLNETYLSRSEKTGREKYVSVSDAFRRRQAHYLSHNPIMNQVKRPADSLEDLRKKNDALAEGNYRFDEFRIESTRSIKETPYNDLAVKLPRSGAKGILLITEHRKDPNDPPQADPPKESPALRLLALAAMYQVKEDLCLDYDLPVILAPNQFNKNFRPYTTRQRLEDVSALAKKGGANLEVDLLHNIFLSALCEETENLAPLIQEIFENLRVNHARKMSVAYYESFFWGTQYENPPRQAFLKRIKCRFKSSEQFRACIISARPYLTDEDIHDSVKEYCKILIDTVDMDDFVLKNYRSYKEELDFILTYSKNKALASQYAKALIQKAHPSQQRLLDICSPYLINLPVEQEAQVQKAPPNFETLLEELNLPDFIYDPTLTNSSGENLLWYAAQTANFFAVDTLVRRHHANLLEPNAKGENVLDFLIRYNDSPFLRSLQTLIAEKLSAVDYAELLEKLIFAYIPCVPFIKVPYLENADRLLGLAIEKKHSAPVQAILLHHHQQLSDASIIQGLLHAFKSNIEIDKEKLHKIIEYCENPLRVIDEINKGFRLTRTDINTFISIAKGLAEKGFREEEIDHVITQLDPTQKKEAKTLAVEKSAKAQTATAQDFVDEEITIAPARKNDGYLKLFFELLEIQAPYVPPPEASLALDKAMKENTNATFIGSFLKRIGQGKPPFHLDYDFRDESGQTWLHRLILGGETYCGLVFDFLNAVPNKQFHLETPNSQGKLPIQLLFEKNQADLAFRLLIELPKTSLYHIKRLPWLDRNAFFSAKTSAKSGLFSSDEPSKEFPFLCEK